MKNITTNDLADSGICVFGIFRYYTDKPGFPDILWFLLTTEEDAKVFCEERNAKLNEETERFTWKKLSVRSMNQPQNNTFMVSTIWTMTADVSVQASSLEEAKEKVRSMEGLPSNGKYLDDSFVVME